MIALLASALLQAPMTTPTVGAKAPAIDVMSLDDKKIDLKPLLKKGPVVLVVLRGYPGYQCPICTRQVGELIANSGEFVKRKSNVVMVYPGPTDNLKGYAQEFVQGKDLPKNFNFGIDPGYTFTNRYGLRWDAPNETAYPSTFVIGKDGKVKYAKVSHSHGDRAPLGDILAALDGMKKM